MKLFDSKHDFQGFFFNMAIITHNRCQGSGCVVFSLLIGKKYV